MEGEISLTDHFAELGLVIGRDCGEEHAGEALSRVLVFLADEATTRPALTGIAIAALLDGMCQSYDKDLKPMGVELTSQGKLACLGS